jgi:4-hydroxybenzoate polyprenyltransferase
MTIRATQQHYASILHHFTKTRAPEVLALQASPLLGCLLGGLRPDTPNLGSPGVLLLGSLALTSHIFVFNDWAGYESDLQDPRRAARVTARQGISRHEVARVALLLLILAIGCLAYAGLIALLLGTAIAILSYLYSCSTGFGKKTPIMGSLNHLLGGMLHFLLGYTSLHAVDWDGVVASLFFGLVFAGGHLNQEVRDYEGDLINGIRTSAVVFGRQQAFLASLLCFTAAYTIPFSLAVFGRLPGLLLFSPLVWVLHLLWSWQAFKNGLGFERAVWLQKRYRILFALVGLAMLAGQPWMATATTALRAIFKP